MGKLWRLVLLTNYASIIALQLLLLWSCDSTAQVPPGFLSIDCGSPSTTSYTDSNNISWISDTDLMTEGETVTTVNSVSPAFLNTMRLFRGNQSKYCYRLKNSAVEPGAFFLIRASFWTDMIPKSSDGLFHFKLLIDADEWWDVNVANDSWIFQEMYTRALRNSIDVCLARSATGDDPFISALELRPLPLNLSATHIMSATNLNFISISHDDSGASTESPALTRYPYDSLDRFWLANTSPTIDILATTATIDTSKDPDKPPVDVLQTSFRGTSDPGTYVTWTYSKRDVNRTYYCLIYFAEIDPRVNASGQRVFDIELNGETTVNLNHVDVFAQVGADTSYEIMAGPISADQDGIIAFNFSATSTSLFSPFFAATEIFLQASKAFSNGSSSSDVIAIEELKASMSLSSYTGDPCLPTGFEYSWLTCVTDTTSTRITSISLSNNLTGGEIPETINTLTMLKQILLDGNNLKGSIPNMSDLINLQTLDLSNNMLKGSIPESLATLQNLKVLLLDGNNLEGSIPNMSDLISLQTLDLRNNMLNGSIPESLATLKNLQVLNLANNNLTGEIPTALLQRQQDLTLDFDFSGNPLCQNSNKVTCTLSPPSSSSKSKRNIRLIVGVVIVVLFAKTF